MQFTTEELERYSRQIDVIGVQGQLKLKNARILIVGLGGLGSPASMYLAASGVGELILVDDGLVELSNLNRQVLYTTRDIGRLKVEVAANKLRDLNPNVKVTTYSHRANRELLDKLIQEVDLVVDGTDNWDTRFIINELCVKHRKPFIHAGVQGFHGQLLVVIPGLTPCLSCIIPFKPTERREIPVVSTTPGVLGLIEATEAIKLITGIGSPAVNRLLVYDGLNMRLHEVIVTRNPNCPVCSRVSNTKSRE